MYHVREEPVVMKFSAHRMQYRFSYFQRRAIIKDPQRRSGIISGARAISIQESVGGSRETGYATRVRRKATGKKRESVSRFECSRKNENARRGTIIARVVSLLRVSIEARSQARSETANQSSGQFRSTAECAKNTTHVPRASLKNQFRKIILIGLGERGARKRNEASKKILGWSILASLDSEIIKYLKTRRTIASQSHNK